ncbi:MAG: hypothetical protein KQA41_00835 [Candidatus Aenigmarchaeota archaeon]|nr:hypothetical protein [Candidatus Aenigmarchaeota archaeon]
MGKIKGLRDDGTIKVETIQNTRDLVEILDYLIGFFEKFGNGTCELSYEQKGRTIEINFKYKDDGQIKTKKIKIEGFDGSRPADFLNTSGIIRIYNSLRSNGKDENYPEINSKIDLSGLDGYGFSPGSFGIVLGYTKFPGDNQIYAQVQTPYGILPIPADWILGREVYRNSTK